VKRLLSIAAAALAIGALSGSAARAGTGGVGLVEAKGPAFPVKTFVLTLPTDRRLTIGDVDVSENGGANGPVLHAKLTPASEASTNTFGVVLVLDKSFSMAGEPLTAALAAAQAFVDQANPNEQIGVIAFNHNSNTVQRLTTDQGKVKAALAAFAQTPQVGGGTHIYDAVHQAESMLKRGHIHSGSIVVLSDGADTGSKMTIDQVAAAARKSNMRIDTIGLNDAQYKPGTLKALAQAGHGEYAQAKAGQLAVLFNELSRILSNEYVLQYESPAAAGQTVGVVAHVKDVGTGGASYTVPAVPISNTKPAPYNPSIFNRILNSPITAIVIGLLGALAIALVVIGVLQPKRSGLPARMAEFVSIRGLQREGGAPGTSATTEVNAVPEQKSAWARFEETLEIAEIKVAPEMIVAGTFAATALTFLLIYAITGSYLWGLFALGVPYIAREWVVRTLRHRRNRFAEQLPDALQVVASALRSGHSLPGALAVVVESASEPMKSEMQRVVADEQLGIPIEKSLLVVADRMDSRDVEQLALVAELQRQAGGNAAEVVDSVADSVRERFDLKRLIQTLTMQGRMSRWIVSALPIGIVLLLQIENPHYLHPLLASTAGKIVFGLAAAWAVAGSFVIKRIVEIEV
jgi:tight adherence protein B